MTTAAAGRVRLTPAYVLLVAWSWAVLCVVLAPATRDAVLRANSTDVANLVSGRVYTLLTSAVLVEGPGCLAVVAAAAAVLAVAERIWGPVRLLRTFLLGHVGASVLVFAGLAAGIAGHVLAPGVATATDVGVSYGLLAVLGALLTEPALVRARRWQAGALALVAGAAVVGHTFTDAGHLVALLLGLAAGHATARGPCVAHLGRAAAGPGTRPALRIVAGSGGRPVIIRPASPRQGPGGGPLRSAGADHDRR